MQGCIRTVLPNCVLLEKNKFGDFPDRQACLALHHGQELQALLCK